jgi:histone H3/H4
MEDFLKEAGAERVTEDAVLNLEKELEKLTETLAKKAMVYAAHAGRTKLINKNDVLLTRDRPGAAGLRRPLANGRRYVIRRKVGATSVVRVRR